MTYVSQHDFEERLAKRLRGAHHIAVVGIGDELSPHDRLGMLAARDIDGLHLPCLRVFLAATVPESVTGPIRRYKPDHIVLLDAADMEARPGTVAVIQPQDITARLFSTHALPLTVVMKFLEDDAKARVTLVGIQPDPRSHGDAPSSLEQAGLTRLLVSVYHICGQPREGRRASGRRSRAM